MYYVVGKCLKIELMKKDVVMYLDSSCLKLEHFLDKRNIVLAFLKD